MLKLREGMRLAEQRAWSDLGSDLRKSIVAFSILVRVLAVLVPAGGLILGGMYVAQHLNEWVSWCGWLLSHYVLPATLVGIFVAIYAISMVVLWHVHGWRWKFNGLSTVRYTMASTLFLVVVLTTVGVGVSL